MSTCFILIGMSPLFKEQCNYFSPGPLPDPQQKLEIASINAIRLISILVPGMNLNSLNFFLRRPLSIALRFAVFLFLFFIFLENFRLFKSQCHRRLRRYSSNVMQLL